VPARAACHGLPGTYVYISCGDTAEGNHQPLRQSPHTWRPRSLRLRQDLLFRWAHGVYQQRPCLLVMALDAGREINAQRWHKTPLHRGTS
jgi:hypothetical protein